MIYLIEMLKRITVKNLVSTAFLGNFTIIFFAFTSIATP
jgi:hypothetical protein